MTLKQNWVLRFTPYGAMSETHCIIKEAALFVFMNNQSNFIICESFPFLNRAFAYMDNRICGSSLLWVSSIFQLTYIEKDSVKCPHLENNTISFPLQLWYRLISHNSICSFILSSSHTVNKGIGIENIHYLNDGLWHMTQIK